MGVNQGVPLVISARDAQFSKDILALAKLVTTLKPVENAEPARPTKKPEAPSGLSSAFCPLVVSVALPGAPWGPRGRAATVGAWRRKGSDYVAAQTHSGGVKASTKRPIYRPRRLSPPITRARPARAPR